VISINSLKRSLKGQKNQFFVHFLHPCVEYTCIKEFCNIQNVKTIYDLLNVTLHRSKIKKEETKNSNAANLFFEQEKEFV